VASSHQTTGIWTSTSTGSVATGSVHKRIRLLTSLWLFDRSSESFGSPEAGGVPFSCCASEKVSYRGGNLLTSSIGCLIIHADCRTKDLRTSTVATTSGELIMWVILALNVRLFSATRPPVLIFVAISPCSRVESHITWPDVLTKVRSGSTGTSSSLALSPSVWLC